MDTLELSGYFFNLSTPTVKLKQPSGEAQVTIYEICAVN